MTLAAIFLIGLGLSFVFYAACFAAHEAQCRAGRPSAPPKAFQPPISIVKPLAGLDADLEENLESFFAQDYPGFEIIFSFARAADPAFAVARRVADRHPAVPASFVVDGRDPGRNAKVNRLAAGVRRARFPYFLFSDGDVRVPRDFLGRAVSSFADPTVGLVSHLFCAVRAGSLGARLEAAYLNGVLRPATAAVARILASPCVVGKSILVSRSALNAIGGLGPLRDYLAEDFLLGKLVQKAGFRVVLASDPIQTVSGVKSLASVWQRHRRWAILRRRLGGPSYAGEALASPALFVAGAMVASGGAPRIVAAALALWAARLGLEIAALRRAGLTARPLEAALLPLRDVALAGLFWAGLAGSRTRWRGRRLVVGPGTLLLAETPRGAKADASKGWRLGEASG